jgi:hypothetical protein
MREEVSQMSIRQDVARVAVERGLRQSTYTAYPRLLGGIGILDVGCVSEEELLERLWTLENPNTRRATIIAVRSVLGFRIRIPARFLAVISWSRKTRFVWP